MLLIRPPAVFRNRPFPDGPRLEVPLGPLSLAAALESEGLEVAFFDALAHPDRASLGRRTRAPTLHFGACDERIGAVVDGARPDVVGINNPFTDHLPFAFHVARLVRERAPGATIVVGGPHATNDPASILAGCPEVDLVLRGEGERSFPRLVRALRGEASAGALDDVPGLVRREGDGLVHGPAADRVPRLDELAWPAYHRTDMEAMFELFDRGHASKFAFGRPGSNRRVSMMTSRGCPYSCTFCDAPQLVGHAFRAHSPEYVLDHVGHLAGRWGVRHLHLNDDNLTVKRARFVRILEGLAARFPDLTWDTPNGVRADDLDEELIALCKRAGCTYLILGVESGDPEVLDRVVGKRLSLDAVERAAAACQAVGLDVHAFYLLGMPGETPAQMERTLAFARDLLRRFGVVPHVNVVEPHVGTEVHAVAVREGYLTEPRSSVGSARSLAAHTHPFPHLRTPHFEPEQLLDLRDRFMGESVRVLGWRAARVLARRPRLVLSTAAYFLGRWARTPLRPDRGLRATLMDRLLFPRRLAGPVAG